MEDQFEETTVARDQYSALIYRDTGRLFEESLTLLFWGCDPKFVLDFVEVAPFEEAPKCVLDVPLLEC